MGLPRGTGSVSRSGKKWRASVRIDGKNRHLGSFDTVEEAEKAVLLARDAGSRGPDLTTLSDWGLTWMNRRATDGIHRGERDERLIWKIRIAPSPIAAKKLAHITPLDVRDWVRAQLASRTKKGEMPARSTLVNALNCLRVCLRDAVDEGLISVNPAHEIRIPRIARTTEAWTWLTMKEIEGKYGYTYNRLQSICSKSREQIIELGKKEKEKAEEQQRNKVEYEKLLGELDAIMGNEGKAPTIELEGEVIEN